MFHLMKYSGSHHVPLISSSLIASNSLLLQFKRAAIALQATGRMMAGVYQ